MIILASRSPRRCELLKMIGIEEIKIIPAEIEEKPPDGLTPEQTVCEIALQKARCVSPFCGGHDTIIAADTLVYIDGQPIGKPADENDAAAILWKLSGRRHSVYTGMAVIRGADCIFGAEKTDVFFREILGAEIAAYIKTGEPMDKAGAYGAQGRGAAFIERIEGDFYNVVGLPVCRLSKMLKDFGIVL